MKSGVSMLALLALVAGCSDNNVSWQPANVGGVSGVGGAGGVTLAGAGAAGTGGAATASGGAATASSGAGGTSEYANFATVGQIVKFKCAGSGCHNERVPTMVNDATLYATLTTYVSIGCGNRFLVKPGAPQESAFYLAQSGLCGTEIPRMPLGCVDNCTPPEYLEGIRQWIANGAPQQ